jgi:hypothetical protein
METKKKQLNLAYAKKILECAPSKNMFSYVVITFVLLLITALSKHINLTRSRISDFFMLKIISNPCRVIT